MSSAPITTAFGLSVRRSLAGKTPEAGGGSSMNARPAAGSGEKGNEFCRGGKGRDGGLRVPRPTGTPDGSVA